MQFGGTIFLRLSVLISGRNICNEVFIPQWQMLGKVLGSAVQMMIRYDNDKVWNYFGRKGDSAAIFLWMAIDLSHVGYKTSLVPVREN